jgi:hypothetical protein
LAEPDGSLFGYTAPAFSAADRLLSTWLSPLPRVIFWGCFMSVVVMLLYRWISPQRKLARLKSDTTIARRQIVVFDGELSGLWPVVRQSLVLSLRQILNIAIPAIVASLPLLACLVWLQSAYGLRAPAPGEPVRLEVAPSSESIRAVPGSALDRDGDSWRVRWPEAGTTVQLLDRDDTLLVAVGESPVSPVVEPRRWWNALLGNPMGYLPSETAIDRLQFGFAPQELIASGPAWIRGWEAPFFLSLFVLSILIKVLFRIE